jgi:NH3-dependent NAD+ synthetase
MLEQLDRTLETAPTPELKEKRVKLRNDLAYINHYPPLQKYLSLFPPSEESQDNKEIREQTYAKIIKTVRAKEAIRDKELFDTDVKMTDEKAAKINY